MIILFRNSYADKISKILQVNINIHKKKLLNKNIK